MERQEIMDMFFQTGVLVKGHFLLTSGRHSDLYLQIAQAFCHPDCSEMLAGELVKRFCDAKVDIVIGPALGGVILSYEVARQLGVSCIYCERVNGRMKLRRGFQIQPGQRVLIVEDVVTTGASLNETIELVQETGGNIAGIGVIIDRTLGSVDYGMRMESIIELDLESHPADECPMCQNGEPLSRPIQSK